MSYYGTLHHKMWYHSSLCHFNCNPGRAHTSDSNLCCYQSIIIIWVAVLLIHLFGRESKSYPGVQYDVSHLCVYTNRCGAGMTDNLPTKRSYLTRTQCSDNISIITGDPNDITATFRQYIIIYCICVSTYVLLVSNEYLILLLLKHAVTVWYIAQYTIILTWMLSLPSVFFFVLFEFVHLLFVCWYWGCSQEW